MIYNILTILAITVNFCVLGLHLPSNFKFCKRSDPSFNECIARAIEDALAKWENGNEEFKIPLLQPYTLDKLVIKEGTSSVLLVQTYNDFALYNLFRPKVKSIKTTITSTQFIIESTVFYNSLNITAHYDFDGKILVFPFRGNGECFIDFADVTSTTTLVGDIFKQKDHNYVDFKKSSSDVIPKTCKLNLTNLFDGDKALGDTMNKLINDNWELLFEDVKGSYSEAIGKIYRDIANRVFKKVPLEDIFPE